MIDRTSMKATAGVFAIAACTVAMFQVGVLLWRMSRACLELAHRTPSDEGDASCVARSFLQHRRCEGLWVCR